MRDTSDLRADDAAEEVEKPFMTVPNCNANPHRRAERRGGAWMPNRAGS